MHTYPPPSNPIHWVLDWDGTLTQHDTLNALVNVAAAHKPHDDIPSKWKSVVQAYLDDYDGTLKQLVPDGKLPSDMPGERKLLKQLAAVEQRSVDRVSASGIFKGLTAEVMRKGAAEAVASGKVQPRSGLRDFLQSLQDRMQQQSETQDVVQVLSVNWSQRFIAGCLAALCPEVDARTPSKSSSEQQSSKTTAGSGEGHVGPAPSAKQPLSRVIVDIYANELEGLSGNSPSTGIIAAKGEHKIISSSDKLAYLLGNRRIDPQTGEHIPIVYVGDSWTDLECLLAADLGICIRDAPMTSSQRQVKETLNRLGGECPHLLDHGEVDDRCNVAWAKDFSEIQRWLESKQEQ